MSSASLGARSVKVSALLLSLAMLPFAGCKSQNKQIVPAFDPPVDTPTSGWGLRKLEPNEYPDMKIAWLDKSNLERAIDKSLKFLSAPSSVRFYPSSNPGDTITHAQVVATLNDIKDMLHKTPSYHTGNI